MRSFEVLRRPRHPGCLSLPKRELPSLVLGTLCILFSVLDDVHSVKLRSTGGLSLAIKLKQQLGYDNFTVRHRRRLLFLPQALIFLFADI